MQLDPGAGDREGENTDLTFIHRVEKRWENGREKLFEQGKKYIGGTIREIETWCEEIKGVKRMGRRDETLGEKGEEEQQGTDFLTSIYSQRLSGH